MPAASQAQQHIMGMVRSFQKGALQLKSLPGTLVGKIKKIAKSMSPSEVKKFASTKTKGLPKHVKESEKIDPSKFSFSQYMQLVEAFSEMTSEEMQPLVEMYGCSEEEMYDERGDNADYGEFGDRDEEPRDEEPCSECGEYPCVCSDRDEYEPRDDMGEESPEMHGMGDEESPEMHGMGDEESPEMHGMDDMEGESPEMRGMDHEEGTSGEMGHLRSFRREEDEEPGVTMDVTRHAVERGGKHVRFGKEEEEPSVTRSTTRQAVERGGKHVRFADEEEETPTNVFGQIKSKIANHVLKGFGHQYLEFAGKVLNAKNKDHLHKAIDDGEMNMDYLTKCLSQHEAEWLHMKEESSKKPKRTNEGQTILEKWASEYKVPASKKGKFKGKDISDLKSKRNALKSKKSRTKQESSELKAVNMAIRAKSGWGKVK